ncbi:hypothetical protein NCCP2716_27620 [Sporosarcina sp. NCCP-2716]|uniref:helix-turn-helix domain containing protein n=1 Tax=Sporosarcina sp. NCCP-2716 TaxID=2943679 RepID=UPI00203B1D25|nr:helix-turn-helix domain containing protein [Sporosarcina sp. NCCP-2716]GKV70264.1 hypothetical protein NCCP2716_27620 [Sporosarcina sp. NCCP-2716]
MVAKHEPIYLLFEDADIKWKWIESELIRFRELWKEGKGIKELASEFRTNQKSIALAVMDQAEAGHIRQRDGGLFGDK